MKTLKYTLFICLLLVAQMASAQVIRISGTVSDDFDVLPGAQIREVDSSNRIVNSAIADGNGKFTMQIKSKKNMLKVTYVGYKEQTLPLNKQVYNIKMSDNVTQIKDVTVKAKKMVKTSGLAIPEREVSFASQGISAKDFEGLGITSVDEALQGRIAGLDIIQSSGDLGAGSQMRLRGTSSISTLTSSEPLIVVNGNIATDLDLSDFDVSTATDEKFAELLKVNTEDISDIRVLKDNNATAIWGTKGANGVIEITTKRGSRGPARVSYSGKFTMTHQPEAIAMLNGDQYTMLLKEAYFNPKMSDVDGNIPELSYRYGNFSEAYMYDNNTDWVGLVRQNGLRQNHYVSVTGGDTKTLFRISGGYDHETGTVIKQAMNRFSTRMNLDYYVSNRIKVSSDFSMTYTKNDKNYDNLVPLGYQKMPNLAPYYEYENGVPSNDYYYMLNTAGSSNGKQTDDKRLEEQKKLANPLASAELAKSIQKNLTLQPYLKIEYNLLGTDDEHHRLRYDGDVFINASNDYIDKDKPRELMTATTTNDLLLHESFTSSFKSLSFTTKHTLTYNPAFKNRDHTALMMGRFEMSSGSASSQSTGGARMPNGVTNPAAGSYITSMASDWSQWKSLAYIFSAHYSWKGRYSLDGNLRMDGTTRFGPSKRWVANYGIGGRWNIIDEPWMQVVREKAKISMLSVAPGWGRNGNSPRADYLYMNKYASVGGKAYLGTVSMGSSGLKLTQFSAEMVNQYNVRFELGVLDDKIKLALDLYSRTTKGMLMPGAGISQANGWSSLDYKNVGDMRNKGWEFNINGSNLAKKGKFWLDFYVNFSNSHNTILSMDENILENMNSNPDVMRNEAALKRIQINNPFGAIYGFRYKGVYQYNYSTAEKIAKADKRNGTHVLQDNINSGITYPIALNAQGEIIFDEKGMPLQMQYYYKDTKAESVFNGGDAIYEDINHDGQINNLDLVYLGSSLPKLNGGFGFTLHYAKFKLSTQFNYRLDFDVYNQGRSFMEDMNGTFNQSQAVNYRWRKEGDVTSIPRALASTLVTNYNTVISDRFIEDASFLRLNYMQLSYSFDSKLIKKWHMSRLNLYCSANNLFCLTKYTGVDPEFGYDSWGVAVDGNKTPRSKSYTVGVNVEF